MTQGYGSCQGDTCTAIKGLQTSQFVSGLPKGFDSSIWDHDPAINNGYPYLLANPPPTNGPVKHKLHH